jgi:hypothetical protein
VAVLTIVLFADREKGGAIRGLLGVFELSQATSLTHPYRYDRDFDVARID